MARVKHIQVKNNDFQHIEVIKQNRYKRHRHGEFFIEGVRSINAALANGWEIEAFIYSASRKLSTWAEDIIKNYQAQFHYLLSENLMKEISDKQETSELLAIARMRKQNLADLAVKASFLAVIFDRPSSPGNLGTVIRSCESLQVDALIITGHSVDVYDGATIKASVGSFFSLPIFVLESIEQMNPLFNKLRAQNIDFQIVGTSAKAEELLEQADFTKATIFILGNEATGMSASYKALCHSCVKIPIYGTASSLNVGCAASIVLYEIDKQRRNLK